MEKEKIIEKLNQIKKGVYTRIVYKKEIAPNCFKLTSSVVRLKVNYYNLKSVLNRQKSGETSKTRTYTDLILMENTIFQNKEGKLKLRVYTTKNHKAKSVYYLNGQEIDKRTLIEMGIEKEKEHRDLDMYTIMFDNIVAIG